MDTRPCDFFVPVRTKGPERSARASHYLQRMENEKDSKAQSQGAGSKFSCISGAQHVIINKKSLFQIVLLALAAFVGTIVAENLRLHHNSTRLKDSRGAMKGTNMRLKAEKDDYKNLFKQMASQLDDWKAAHDLSLDAQKTRIASFKESSEELMVGLDDVRTVLEEKEFQLWEKEGLLEYQEERLLDSEDQEVQMALYINMLAQQLLLLELPLPDGLDEQPYYGQEHAKAHDDGPSDDAIRRRRRLRAAAPPKATAAATGAYRAHLLRNAAAAAAKRLG